jgi:methylenetetrahydrofolate reductase (NADPH)
VLAELTGGPGFSLDPIEKFLKARQEKPGAIPAKFDLAAITLPQSPGGVANIEPASVISRMQAKGLLAGLDVVPHVTCKDMNSDAIVSSLMSFKSGGVESLLALTGDKPVKSAGVFELESLGLLRLIRRINRDAYVQASPRSLGEVHQFFPGAAVSPFKYTEASQMQQYYKMEKKIACGAEFLITQVGWDWRKSLELFTYLKEAGLAVPVIGNVYLLSTLTPAPRLMHDGKLPGCFVSDELLAKVQSERISDHLERAAQQVAMYRALGAAGVDIGGVPDFDMFTRILQRAAEIGAGWEPFKDNLAWPPRWQDRRPPGGSVKAEGLGDGLRGEAILALSSPAHKGGTPSPRGDHRQAAIDAATGHNAQPDESFYLYELSGERVRLATPRPTFAKRFFDFSHRAILDPKHTGFHAFKKTMAVFGADKGKGTIYRLFNSSEKAFKSLSFECEECGDCFLPENFGLCTMGGCEKGMDNAPCGDATANGRCGNNLERICIGERIYEAAVSEKTRAAPVGATPRGCPEPGQAQGPAPTAFGRERLRTIINKPRNPALAHTSSLINYLFGKDHTMKAPFIAIGESIHASIPKTGKIMRELHELGANAYSGPSTQLEYIKALIESQAEEGADYIAVNLDAFGEDNQQQAVEMMVQYTRLVRQWSRGVPICIDSSSDNVLIAGLKEWYAQGSGTRGQGSVDDRRPPLLNSVKVYTMDRMLPLKKDYDFSFIGLLVSEDKPTGPGGSHSVDELYGLAKRIFEQAVGRYGFRPNQIFFDSTVFPLAIDMPMEPGVPGYTYRTFETIKKIKSDPQMKGVHCSLGVSNSVRDLPARKIGVCRAYMAKAMEYGLDAGIVNTAHQYGSVEAPPELLALVDAYAKLDGSMDKMTKAMELMGQFCRENRKSS